MNVSTKQFFWRECRALEGDEEISSSEKEKRYFLFFIAAENSIPDIGNKILRNCLTRKKLRSLGKSNADNDALSKACSSKQHGVFFLVADSLFTVD